MGRVFSIRFAVLFLFMMVALSCRGTFMYLGALYVLAICASARASCMSLVIRFTAMSMESDGRLALMKASYARVSRQTLRKVGQRKCVGIKSGLKISLLFYFAGTVGRFKRQVALPDVVIGGMFTRLLNSLYRDFVIHS